MRGSQTVIPIIDAVHAAGMSSERIEKESYEAITGTADETARGMRAKPAEKPRTVGAVNKRSEAEKERNS